MSAAPSFDYRGLKLIFGAWAVGMVGASLAIFLCIGWPAYLLIVIAAPMALAGMVLHWRELIRQDRRWRKDRKPAQGADGVGRSR